MTPPTGRYFTRVTVISTQDDTNHDLEQIPATLVVVAPRANSGGVGDYAEDFVSEAAKGFQSFHEIRTGGPGQVGILDLVKDRLRLKRVLKQARGDGRPVVLHFELSAGSLAPFWLLAGQRGSLTTATVHDPPFSVWWPFRSRMIAKNRWINHGLHFPLRRLSAAIERRVLKNTVLIALSDLGKTGLQQKFPGCEVLSARHYVPSRPKSSPAVQRPLAIGLFGHAYKGKGFDRLVELRGVLPDQVDIVVAGRGTEKLAPVPGVTILGGVDGAAEDDFFNSVRAILLPYANTSRYGEILSVSGVAARAFAYGTPVVASESGTLSEASRDGGLVTAPNDVQLLSELTFATVTDDATLRLLGEQATLLQASRSLAEAVTPFKERWGKVASKSPA